jgi:hypothetical protein
MKVKETKGRRKREEKMQQNVTLWKCRGSKFIWTATDCSWVKGVIMSALVSNKLSYFVRLWLPGNSIKRARSVSANRTVLMSHVRLPLFFESNP